MYLKFIRHQHPYGELRRGTLYSVHFQPNEKGDYNVHLTPICDAYEIARGDSLPLPLIYPAGLARINGSLRLTLGDDRCRSALHLIDIHAREVFIPHVQDLLRRRIDVRIEVV